MDILEFAARGIKEDSGEVVYEMRNKESKNIFSGEEYLHYIFFHNSACNKLYKTNFLKEKSLLFMEHTFIEDIQFNIRAIFFAKKIACCNIFISHFTQNPESITRSNDTEKKIKMVNDIKKVILSIDEFISTNVRENSIAYKPLKRRLSSLINLFLVKSLLIKRNTEQNMVDFNYFKKKGLYPMDYKEYTYPKEILRIIFNFPFTYLLANKLRS